jgi:hypothetical protein
VEAFITNNPSEKGLTKNLMPSQLENSQLRLAQKVCLFLTKIGEAVRGQKTVIRASHKKTMPLPSIHKHLAFSREKIVQLKFTARKY